MNVPVSDLRGAAARRPRTRLGNRRTEGGRESLLAPLGLIGIGLYLTLFTYIANRYPYDIWAAYLFAPILLFVGSGILRRLLPKVEDDPWIHKAIRLGLIAKILGGFSRFYVNEVFLGHADASGYYLAGSAIAAEFRQLIFGGPAYQLALPDYTGTRFMRLVTSIPYVVTGSTQIGGYVIFAFFSFWGLYLFYRAFCIAVPDGLRRRYAVLIFFLPSVVFWPSSIGKEAWMTTMLGIGSYGLARLLVQRQLAYPALIASFAGMGIVRPHVAAIFGAGMGAAFVLRRSSGGGATSRKILGLLALAVVAGVLMNQLQSFFGLDSALDAQQVFDETTRRSGQGGSEFQSAQPTSPAQLPWAVVTVLFRPFIFEASSVAGLITALEGSILLALFFWNLPRLARLPGLMVVRPYVGYAVVYTFVFVFAFSAISNFGILARQRTQLFPIATVVLCVPIQSSLRTRKDVERQRARAGESASEDEATESERHAIGAWRQSDGEREAGPRRDGRWAGVYGRSEPAPPRQEDRAATTGPERTAQDDDYRARLDRHARKRR